MNNVMKIAGFALLAIGMSGHAMAIGAPEIDPASGATALALLSGTLLVLRGRRRK